jgi:hypothetical protein
VGQAGKDGKLPPSHARTQTNPIHKCFQKKLEKFEAAVSLNVAYLSGLDKFE